MMSSLTALTLVPSALATLSRLVNLTSPSTLPAYADEEATVHSIFPSLEARVDDQFEENRLKAIVTDCLGVLDDREYRILRCYFGLGELEPMTLEQIGRSMGVTRERVRQLRNRALEKLKTDCGELLGEFSKN